MTKKMMILLALALTVNIMAQKPEISFDVKTYDFGKINEADGKVSYTFNFVNTGKSALVINRVQASCGCTTPDWTKSPVEPGKKGVVTAIYNPEGRPGIFTKTITVYSNATDETVTLMFKGEVIPKAVTEANPFPFKIGDLSAKQRILQFNNISKGNTVIRELEIKNTGKSTIKTTVANLPGFITARMVPDVLKPNDEAKIIFTINSKLCSQWGPLNQQVYIVLNGQKKYSDEFMIRLNGNVVEDFTKLTIDQKRNAPITELESGNVINVGEIKAGSKKIAKFILKNRGVNPLEIRRIINQNQEMNIRPLKTVIANGQSGQIHAEITTNSLPEGDYRKSFTVQTNDPDKSFMIYVVQWKVVK